MRFLIPNFRTPDSFVDNVSYTLCKMGHEVKTMPNTTYEWMDNKVIRAIQLVGSLANPYHLTKQEAWLQKTLKSSERFDVLLTLTQMLSEESLHLARKKGIRTIVWWGDTPANMKKQGLIVKGWDFIYIKDKNAALKLNGLGLNASYLHEAMNPAWHKPLYKNINDKLIVAGSFYDYRNYLVNALINKGVPFEIYGRRLSKWNYASIAPYHKGHYVVKSEKSKVFGEGLACLNSTAMSEFNSLNCRAFEIAGAEGLHFMEYRPALEECFEPDKEVKTFRSIEEVVELYNWALKYPKEAMQVRKAARKRALAEHTYQHRLEYIISRIK